MTSRSIFDLSVDLAARIYLSASYLYYIRNVSMMEDTVYDLLCKRLLENYDQLSDERKAQISKGDLEAGTCLKSHDDYSSYTRSSSEFWIRWEENVDYLNEVTNNPRFIRERPTWHA